MFSVKVAINMNFSCILDVGLTEFADILDVG